MSKPNQLPFANILQDTLQAFEQIAKSSLELKKLHYKQFNSSCELCRQQTSNLYQASSLEDLVTQGNQAINEDISLYNKTQIADCQLALQHSTEIFKAYCQLMQSCQKQSVQFLNFCTQFFPNPFSYELDAVVKNNFQNNQSLMHIWQDFFNNSVQEFKKVVEPNNK